MVVDLTRCNGCYNCQLACKDEHVGNDYLPIALAQPEMGHFWLKFEEKERGKYPWVKMAYLVLLCQHCDEAPCIKEARDGAVYKRPDGIVIIDPVRAKDQKQLVQACPYGVIYWNEEKRIPQKCTFCAHLLDEGWKEPRCVEACPTQALVFGDIEDPNSEVSHILRSEKLEVLHPEYGTKPRVYYMGLPKPFLAGSVVLSDIDECAEGVKVNLIDKATRWSTTTFTNNYGDFEFDGLELGKDYTLTLELDGYETKVIEVKLEADTYLGEIFLIKRR